MKSNDKKTLLPRSVFLLESTIWKNGLYVPMPPSGLEFHPPVGTAVWPHIPERGERAYESKTCLIGRSCAPKGIPYIRIIQSREGVNIGAIRNSYIKTTRKVIHWVF